MRAPRSVVITGGSSGIGEALALLYAAPGVALALTGRDAARLEEVAARCRAEGATVTTARLDSSDRAGMADWLAEVDARTPVDLLIANAGISAGTGGGMETEEQARRIFAVNLDGVLNTVHPLLPAMRVRRRGQIALMSSLAAFRGFPGAPAYCASKAAVRVYGESLRDDLAAEGVGVSVICPGFVKSRMTAVNRFPMPFLMETEAAARVIRRGLERNRARIAFPLPMAASVWLLSLLPPGWTDGLLVRAPRKGGQARR
ncbi:SDR family NAD(P)-dependent oxidoreductase [Azospirillum thermophilum]|uniref:Short-chain dehydrogenase n=1 Tax=Azospirillum thermophilum TaxID=2202148 RepID=A0A2S2CQW2_9PROT|nr:SDR family NAD(P)-dependent oxidoreductase [Azospirillum thermophilum]AWK86901.1 short-chain dehydrogenase [Azospirillum thermophilum]